MDVRDAFPPLFALLSALPPIQDDGGLVRNAPRQALHLAWALRQVDPERAVALLAAIDPARLNPADLARIHLLKAEWAMGRGELATVQSHLDGMDVQSLSVEHPPEKRAADAPGERLVSALRSDACLLARRLALAHGRAQLATESTREALDWAERAADPMRVAMVQCYLALGDVLTHASSAEAAWRDPLETWMAGPSSERVGFAGFVLGCMAYQLGRPDQAVLAYSQAFDRLLAYGQTVHATLCAANAAAAYDDLQDHAAALEWAQRGLDLARSAGSLLTTGYAAFRVAERLRVLQRLDEAKVMLDEARTLLGPHQASRNFILLLVECGHLALARGDLSQALIEFETARERAASVPDADLTASAWQGLASTALKADALDEAEAAARQVLQMARTLHRPAREAEAQMTLARCQQRRGALAEATASMRAALDREVDQPSAPASWWGELADCLASQGDYAQAYEARLRAERALRQERKEEAERRALALQVRVQTAQLQAQAQADRQRADLLEAATQTLMRLGEVGQELTSLLDEAEIYPAIQRHVEGLLQAEYFGIYLLEPDGLQLKRVFAAQGERRFEPDWVPVDHPLALSARCLREGTELVLDLDPNDQRARWIPGAERSRSGMFAPLRNGPQVLGVLSIQATRERAFAEPERQLFRSLCAYASIAIANARAYRRLEETQRHLARRQRLAAVGAMVAGVAHEMNTPIGNALLAASSLKDAGVALERSVAEGRVGRTQLQDFVRELREAGDLVVGSLGRATQLVQDFKQLVPDMGRVVRRCFLLCEGVEQALLLHRERAAALGHRMVTEIPVDLEVDGFPEPLSELLRHWADNALQHGLAHHLSGGELSINARALPEGAVELRLRDNGAGMSAEVQERAFDPFFSTRFSGIHSGLGMAVMHSVAVDLFGGHLRLQTAPGQGAELCWVFPRVAPKLGEG